MITSIVVYDRIVIFLLCQGTSALFKFEIIRKRYALTTQEHFIGLSKECSEIVIVAFFLHS